MPTLYLSSMKPASAQGIGAYPVSAIVNKVPYRHSVAQYQELCSESEQSKEWEYSVGSGYKSFTVWMGLSDDNSAADLSVTFEVYADGKLAVQKEITAGPARKVTVDTRNVRRLKLVSSFSISQHCYHFDEAIWGNAQLS
ncbi:NPCBM/NEW2 domain-containing protein [Streptomyces sp. NPDC049541]|uniref:NPCBM/NEW2 domain-containing protein n=1 Tax=Streptomyces sp. NPDC049541 TaxID=3365594 RepID=UPI003793F9BA